MRKLFSVDNLILLLNVVSAIAFTAYFYSMFVHPFIDGGWSWKYVQSVWFSWQALNVGMLAFGASIIAFNISRYHVAKQLEREFVTAKAFLPQALSELCQYLGSSAPALIEAYQNAKDIKHKRKSTDATIPVTPSSHIVVFSDCIKSATPEIAQYLASILMKLQVHNARMQVLPSEGGSYLPYAKSCLYSLVELQVLVNALFDFARNKKSFDGCKHTMDQYLSALNQLGLKEDDYEELFAYIYGIKFG